LIMGQFAIKVDTQPFPGINMVEGHMDAANGLCDADWISRLTSIWQDHCDVAVRRRGPVPVIGPGKAKGSTSLKNR
jgi:hypothetical protein